MAEGKTEDDFLAFRTARNTLLAEPALLRSIQFNICARQLPSAEVNSLRYLLIPVEAKNLAL